MLYPAELRDPEPPILHLCGGGKGETAPRIDSFFHAAGKFASFMRMSTKAKLQSTIENAIQKADASYFFEDYTKQAKAVLAALDAAGFAITPRELPEELWKQVANAMKTGRVKPEEHVKDVFQVALKLAAVK